MLQSLGYQVAACADGEEALKHYAKSWQNIDVVILDMVMPKMGGREVFLALRKINPGVKVLLASGRSVDGEAQGILDEGVLGFIQKPFRSAELSAKLVEVLKK